MIPARYDLSIPANQRKLDAADALGQLADEAGISLIDMAIAFVIRHPAVTAAIIGPRTMEQLESQLGAADVQLDDALLDRIDEIVAPGTTSTRATPGGRTPRSRLRRGGDDHVPKRWCLFGLTTSALTGRDDGVAGRRRRVGFGDDAADT